MNAEQPAPGAAPGADPGAGLFRVGVRIPPFWPEDPALWFAQLEGQFALSNITNDVTKFYYVTAQLDHRYAAEVKDVITSPPDTGRYDKLKLELIKRLSASQEKKVTQLLTHEELGDRKPSQFLRHLQNLAGPSVPKDFIKTIWTSRLPHSVQTIVVSQADLPLESLADLADRVQEIAPPTCQVASTATCQAATSTPCQVASTEPSPSYEQIIRQISELSRQVASLSSNMNRRAHKYNSRPRSRSASRQRSNSHSHSANNNSEYCWYHSTFGTKARKCVAPCRKQEVNNKGDRI